VDIVVVDLVMMPSARFVRGSCEWTKKQQWRCPIYTNCLPAFTVMLVELVLYLTHAII
jgi:hypothetical protein